MRKFSICIPLDGMLKKKTINLISKLNKINKEEFKSIPHINILSGSYNNQDKLIRSFKKILIKKKKPIICIGTGVFLGKKNVFYLRFETSNLIKNIRKKSILSTKIKKNDIDYTASDKLWVPKCTLCMTKLKNNDFLRIMNKIKRELMPNSFTPKKILLMDVTSEEKILGYIKI